MCVDIEKGVKAPVGVGKEKEKKKSRRQGPPPSTPFIVNRTGRLPVDGDGVSGASTFSFSLSFSASPQGASCPWPFPPAISTPGVAGTEAAGVVRRAAIVRHVRADEVARGERADERQFARHDRGGE